MPLTPLPASALRTVPAPHTPLPVLPPLRYPMHAWGNSLVRVKCGILVTSMTIYGMHDKPPLDGKELRTKQITLN